MEKPQGRIQPAVKKESIRITVMTALGVVLMVVLFFVGNFLEPDYIPFGWNVVLGGIGGGIVASLNFFLMALTVQRITSLEDEQQARKTMQFSYSRRFALQVAWMLVAILAPCFQFVAAILPLLFPTLGIKIKGILDAKKNLKEASEAASQESSEESSEECSEEA